MTTNRARIIPGVSIALMVLALGAAVLTGRTNSSSGVPAVETAVTRSAIENATPGGDSGPALLGVFEGTTPCDRVAKPLPQVNSDCEMAAWEVSFGPGSSYTLNAVYGMAQANSLTVGRGRTTVSMQGTWVADSPSTVRLTTNDPQVGVSLLWIGDNILHVLDAGGRMMVGNGGWSYTLNRTSPRSGMAPTPLLGGHVDGSAALTSGVFEGRTPCIDALRPFTANLVPGCSRLKWRITLYHDPAAGEPSRYVSGVVGRADAIAGSWRAVYGAPYDPAAAVYQLTPEAGGRALSLLRLGNNHLLFLDEGLNLLAGDKLWSYTLSRVAE